MAATPTTPTPAGAPAPAKVFGIWTDVAAVYALPLAPLSKEDDAALARLVLEWQPVAITMEHAMVLLDLVGSHPDLPFEPYPWVIHGVKLDPTAQAGKEEEEDDDEDEDEQLEVEEEEE